MQGARICVNQNSVQVGAKSATGAHADLYACMFVRDRATLGSSFIFNGMWHVLVLFDRKSRGRRVGRFFLENVDAGLGFQLNENFERGDRATITEIGL